MRDLSHESFNINKRNQTQRSGSLGQNLSDKWTSGRKSNLRSSEVLNETSALIGVWKWKPDQPPNRPKDHEGS